MSRILFFSRSLYPKKGGSAFVTENLAANFNDSNMVVIGGKAMGAGEWKRSQGPLFFYLTTQINIKGRGDRFFEWLRWFLFPAAYFRSVKIAREQKAGAVLATFPDGFFLLLALTVARKLRIPVSTYFHNTYLENRKGLSRRIAASIQARAFRESRAIYVMSEGMAIYYREQYPAFKEKFKPLVHTFATYPDVPEKKIEAGQPKYQAAFIGNFNESNIEATGRIVELLGKDPRFQLNFYTPVPKLFLQARGIDLSAINYVGYVSDQDFYPTIAQNDLLILTHGFTGGYSRNEYETIFPTRSIPFLLLKRPIVLHSPDFAYLTRFFRERKAALILDSTNKEQILEKINTFINDPEAMRQTVSAASMAAREFYGPEVVKQLMKDLGIHEQ